MENKESQILIQNWPCSQSQKLKNLINMWRLIQMDQNLLMAKHQLLFISLHLVWRPLSNWTLNTLFLVQNYLVFIKLLNLLKKTLNWVTDILLLTDSKSALFMVGNTVNPTYNQSINFIQEYKKYKNIKMPGISLEFMYSGPHLSS